MKSILTHILIGVIIAVASSCRATFKTQEYRFQPTISCVVCDEDEVINQIQIAVVDGDVKGIRLINDSILEYWESYGGLAILTTIRYTLIENNLIVNSTDIYKRNIPAISNAIFMYSKDSLVNNKTNEKYYNQKHLDKIK